MNGGDSPPGEKPSKLYVCGGRSMQLGIAEDAICFVIHSHRRVLFQFLLVFSSFPFLFSSSTCIHTYIEQRVSPSQPRR